MIDPLVALKAAIEHMKDASEFVGEIELDWDQSHGDQVSELHIVVRSPIELPEYSNFVSNDNDEEDEESPTKKSEED